MACSSLADSANWDFQILFDLWDYSGIQPGSADDPLPRLFYGSPASDMDNDGKDEYVFVNYSAFVTNPWDNEAYVWMIEVDVASDVADSPTGVPTQVGLSQNYPNPFNPSTTITYTLSEASEVRLSVFDMLGKEVGVLVNDRREAGAHVATFDGRGLASGVYLYRLQARPLGSAIGRDSRSGAGEIVQTRRLMLLR